jgi:hypothetical protein
MSAFVRKGTTTATTSLSIPSGSPSGQDDGEVVDDKKERRYLFALLRSLPRRNLTRDTVTVLLPAVRRLHRYKIMLILIGVWLLVGVKTVKHRSSVHWAKGLLHRKHTCQNAPYQPFMEGCPASCKGYRPTITTVTNHSRGSFVRIEPFFHTTIFWAFGQPHVYQEVGSLPPKSAYDVGINFQCSEEFVRSFVHAREHVDYEATDKIPKIRSHGQKRMQLDLMCLCCLTRQEAYMARQVLETWLYEKYPFQVSVKFDELQCWRTHYNALSNMIIATSDTQKELMEMNHELRDLLRENNVPIIIERESQIPFHVKLNTFSLGDTGPHKDDKIREPGGEHDITKIIPSMYDIIQPFSKAQGMTWTGQDGHPMIISHPPQMSKDPIEHTKERTP